MSFQWISADTSRSSITLDAHKRIYLSADACKTVGVDPGASFTLIVGYDTVNERIVVAKPSIVKAVNVRPYKFDKRRYASARAILHKAAISSDRLPLHYDYVGKDYLDADYPDGSFVFQLRGHSAPDEVGTSD